jgi:chromate reductase
MTFTVLGISGSLRSQSSNSGLIAMAQRLAPSALSFEIDHTIALLPFYNADLDTPETWPEPVRL